jgi:anti-sigma regulatory factor (Ser/Thr protein kinase)
MLMLRPGPGAPALARTSVRAWLAAEGLEEFQEPVLVVVSELVTNAVVHARTELAVSFAADERGFEVGVSDHDRRWPRLSRQLTGVTHSDGNLMDGGRGLVIVDALADEWGTTPTIDGKRVWARWSAGSGQAPRPP